MVANFGYDAGGWRVEQHPRFLADTTGDGRADIVGFGNAGVYVSRAQADGTFAAPQLVVANFGYDAGGWRVDRHPRFLADMTGDGRADIVGFGNAGVYVSLRPGRRQLRAPGAGAWPTSATTPAAGGWSGIRGSSPTPPATGVPTSSASATPACRCRARSADGTYEAPGLVITNFGYDAGGWRVEQHPRFLADITGDGRADIVGFGNAGVWMSQS